MHGDSCYSKSSPDKQKQKRELLLNIRTMTNGINTENISNARKNCVINNKLLRLRIDITAL